ncbi:hypothetical protein ES703_100063 [subsurface metagenome]
MSNTTELIPLYSDFIILYSKQGNDEGVTQFKKKEKKIVEDILNGIKDTELKNSFLENRKIKNLI